VNASPHIAIVDDHRDIGLIGKYLGQTAIGSVLRKRRGVCGACSSEALSISSSWMWMSQARTVCPLRYCAVHRFADHHAEAMTTTPTGSSASRWAPTII